MSGSNPVTPTAGKITAGPTIVSTGPGNPLNIAALASPSFFLQQNESVTTTSGSRAGGCSGYLLQPGQAFLGAWTYWPGTSAYTLIASLWVGPESSAISTWTRVASGSLAVSAAGWYYIPFSSSYPVTTNGQGWAVTVFESTGSVYASCTLSSLSTLLAMGPWNVCNTWATYGGSATIPPTTTGTAYYPVDPVMGWVVTTTAAAYTQPAVGSSVAITVTSATGITAGMLLIVSGYGIYRVSAVSGVTITAWFFGDSANSVPAGSTVPAGATVYP